MEREQEIRMIAYSLWVQDGHCRGGAIRRWLQAEAIWEKRHNQETASGIKQREFEQPLEPNTESISSNV